MEFITGLKQQEEAELEDLLKAEEGTTIILEGAVHSIRDMGEIAFVILRKREGLIQTVWEEGKRYVIWGIWGLLCTWIKKRGRTN